MFRGERHRPVLEKRPKEFTRANEQRKEEAIASEINENGLVFVVNRLGFSLAEPTSTPTIDSTLNTPSDTIVSHFHAEDSIVEPENDISVEDRTREIEEEVGISKEVIEIFAEDQNRVSVNCYALLDEEFAHTNPQAPRTIIEDDYSPESRP